VVSGGVGWRGQSSEVLPTRPPMVRVQVSSWKRNEFCPSFRPHGLMALETTLSCLPSGKKESPGHSTPLQSTRAEASWL
jgi:hypothetical protein